MALYFQNLKGITKGISKIIHDSQVASWLFLLHFVKCAAMHDSQVACWLFLLHVVKCAETKT